MDAPWSRRSDLFAPLDDVDEPDLWDEICRRSQERTRVYVALAAPRRVHGFAPRGALALAVAAVLLAGGFLAGRRSNAGAVPKSAAGAVVVDGAAATTVPLVAAAPSSAQRCNALTLTYKIPAGMK